ncbi:WUSCHEL-related homeobox 11-like [Canna indica]|uniref:WUSCHEL-related homeobox 11-like n=1 Tax=Canna indica TaxID=4628 RepID=A0AAQ3KTL0_9LILI|nr:WUSCHEL-related homeobox 11-like [Canna indica]
MADLNQDHANLHRSTPDRPLAEPVRTRWTPKPEQILILESIFNSGMVNPPKDDILRIRKILEKFGSVGDANVFYWFQNRRSRSRRRQRQLQASLMQQAAATAGGGLQTNESTSASSINNSCGGDGGGFFGHSSTSSSSSSPRGFLNTDDAGSDDLFSISGQMEITNASPPFTCSSDVSCLHYQSGTITVFIDGVACEVARGPFNLRAMFGDNVMLVHSSGEFLPVNGHGVLMQSLQMGESYFLVTRPT